MDINRNQYFAVGVVVLLLGIQFRYVESFTLNSQASQFVREKLSKKKKTPSLVTTNSSYNNFWGSEPIVPSTMTVTPPKWLGWALLSTGGVLVLHALALRKPDG